MVPKLRPELGEGGHCGQLNIHSTLPSITLKQILSKRIGHLESLLPRSVASFWVVETPSQMTQRRLPVCNSVIHSLDCSEFQLGIAPCPTLIVTWSFSAASRPH